MIGFLFLACFGFPCSGSADGAVFNLDEVVVSATKTTMELDNVSTNITVIPREKIERYEARDVSDLLRQVPGFMVSNINGGLRTDMHVSSRGNQPSTRGAKIMVNGIEFNNGSGYFNVLKIPINDIEQIEVMKNPSSSLYGNLGTGGVINIVTRKAREVLSAKAGTEIQSYDGKRTFGVLNGAKEDWEYHLEGAYFESDGYRDNAGEENGNLYGRLAFHPDETSTIELQGVCTDSKNRYPGAITQAQYEENRKQTNQPYGKGESDNTLIAASYRKDFEDSTLLAKVKYDTQNGFALESWGHFDFDNYIVIPELNYTVYANLAGMDHTLLFGSEYRYYDSDSLSHNVDSATGRKLSVSKDRSQEDKDWAFFIQDEINVTGRLTLTLGGRYDHFKTDLEDKQSPDKSFDSSDSALSPNAGIAFQLTPGNTLFANYTRAFKKPVTPAYIDNLNLDPEKIDSVEVGMRGEVFRFLSYNIALFYTETKDKVVRTGSVFNYENAGELRARGVEIGLDFDFDNGLTGSVNYTRQSSEWQDWTQSGTSYEGKQLPRLPKDILGLSAGYRHPVFGNIFAYANYTGSKYMDNNNTRELGSYFVVNTKYTKKFTFIKPDLEFFASVKNLFDKEYVETGYAGDSWEELYPMPGRSFTAGVSVAF